ncbi:TIGR03545 family protein [bacterium]|nr:TIGR03545 family protein [bacterium]
MKRWIRPQGIVVFFLLVAALAALSFIFSGTIVKRSIEKAGTAVAGARVDVGHARLSLSPLGLILTDLQVTNALRPMENTVQVDRIAFNMDSGALLRRKVLVEEMALEGMAFNTPRKSSGAVVKPAKAQGDSDGGFKLPALKTPPVSEILAQEDLLSVQRSRVLQERAAADQKHMEIARTSLPDKARVAQYQKQLDTLLSAKGLTKARVDEAKTLQKEIRGERDRVQAAEDQVTASLSSLKTQLKEARGSVGEDVSRLKEKYALSPEGLANITRTLLGDAAGLWADRGVQALKLLSYLPSMSDQDPKKAQPPRGKGVDVPLTDRMLLPGLWVKRAALSLTVPSGVIAGEAVDMSSDQALLKKPATFKVSGRNLSGGASLMAGGILDRTDPAAAKDEFNLNYDGWQVADLKLSGSESLPVTLRRGSGTVAGNVIMRGEALEGSVRVNLSSVAMEAAGTNDNSLSRAMRAALTGVQKFSINADVTGTLDDPKVRLTSDLDRILKDAVGKAAREEADKLEAGLRTAIEEKTGPALAEAQKSLQALESAKAQLAAVKVDLEEALKAKAAVKLPF